MHNNARSPKSQNNYTPEEVRQLKIDREGGMSIEDLMFKFGRSYNGITRKLSLHGIKIKTEEV